MRADRQTAARQQEQRRRHIIVSFHLLSDWPMAMTAHGHQNGSPFGTQVSCIVLSGLNDARDCSHSLFHGAVLAFVASEPFVAPAIISS